MDLLNKRNISFDFISALLIFYMVFCHVMQWAKLTHTDCYSILQRFMFFFMAWFFFKSGIFAKTEGNIKVYVARNAKMLLIPALVFTIIGLPFVWYQLYSMGDYNIIHYTLSIVKSFIVGGNLTGNLPLWFLVTLFEVKVLYVLLRKFMGGQIIFLLSLFVAYVIYMMNLHRPCYIFSVFTAMVFYAGGNILAKHMYSSKMLVFSIMIYVSSVAFFPQMVDLRTCTLVYGNYFLWMLVSIAACVTLNNIVKYIEPYLPSFMIKVGKNSMNYYVAHWLVLSYTSIIISKITEDSLGWKYFYLQFFTVILILPFISYCQNTQYGRKLLGR